MSDMMQTGNPAPASRNENPEDSNDALDEMLRMLAEARAQSDDDQDEYDEDDEDDREVGESTDKDADDYHNEAVRLANRDQYKRAVNVCLQGLEHWPDNVDLLADVIKYAVNCGMLGVAEMYFQLLGQRQPRKRWNWRAYTFSLDYLMLKPEENEKICRELIKDYQSSFPADEKSRVAEAELEDALGNPKRAMEVLTRALEQLPNAPQCALRLADKQMDCGMYDVVVKTCNYGLAASCAAQPAIYAPYLLLLRTLATDALLHRKAAVTSGEIADLDQQYALLEECFPTLCSRYDRSVTTRRKILRFMQPTDEG